MQQHYQTHTFSLKSTSPEWLSHHHHHNNMWFGHQWNLGCAALSCCSITISLPLKLAAQKKIGSVEARSCLWQETCQHAFWSAASECQVDEERSRSQSRLLLSRFIIKGGLFKNQLNQPVVIWINAIAGCESLTHCRHLFIFLLPLCPYLGSLTSTSLGPRQSPSTNTTLKSCLTAASKK